MATKTALKYKYLVVICCIFLIHCKNPLLLDSYYGLEVDEDSGSASDADTDTDTDTDVDTDVDTSDTTPSSEKAYFLSSRAWMGKINNNEGCDVNGDGDVDLAMTSLYNSLRNWASGVGMAIPEPDDTLALGIETGRLLAIIAFESVQDFNNDDNITMKSYQGQISPDFDPAVDSIPDDLYSGQGSVGIAGSKSSPLSQSTVKINNGAFNMPNTSNVNTQIPFGDQIFNVVIEQGRMSGEFNPIPNGNMLQGKILDGMLCGAVRVEKVTELIVQAMPSLSIFKNMVRNICREKADVTCEGDAPGSRNCLSIGAGFESVSVAIQG